MTQTTTPTRPLPNLDGFDTCYGVRVVVLGEDFDLLALGHHDRRRALAAFNRYSRRVIGDALGAAELVEIRYTWAVLAGECGECDDPADVCEQCQVVRAGGWWLEYDDEYATDPDAFPVTVLPWP